MSSNPSAGYLMDIFSYLFVVRIVMSVRKDKNKHKRGRGRPIFLKKVSKRFFMLIGGETVTMGEMSLACSMRGNFFKSPIGQI